MISLNISEYWVKKFHLTVSVPCPCWFLAVSTLWIAEAKILDNINGKLWALLSQRPPPPPPRVTPGNLAFFCLMDGKSRGAGAVKLSNAGGDENIGQMPRPNITKFVTWCKMRKSVLTQTFLIIHVIVFPIWNFQTLNQKPCRMNEMLPIAKRENSCTLKSHDLSILEFEI